MHPRFTVRNTCFYACVGIALNADSEPLTLEERVEAVGQVLQFSEGRMSEDDLRGVYEKEEQLKSAIVFAREYLKGTKISQAQMAYLCEEALRGGCQGHRAEISAARVALASAALEGKFHVISVRCYSLFSNVATVEREKFVFPYHGVCEYPNTCLPCVITFATAQTRRMCARTICARP
jgi:Mg-chelatase subunit ChlI